MSTSAVDSQKTIQQIIDSTSESSGASTRNTGELGKDDFLNLLVTQLRYQDPLNPTDDKEFIGQMAQFSALEQMQNLNTSMTQSQAYSLIGKRVTASVTDEDTQETETVTGSVTSVKTSSGKVYVVVQGKDIPIEQITEVNDAYASSDANIANFTSLIGSKVDGCIYDSETGDIIAVNGVVESIQKGVYEDYAVMDGVQVEMSDVVTDTPSTDPDFKENYLEENMGKEVSINVIDRSTGRKVPVKATLRDYEIASNGNIKVTLDQVYVPVESISGVSGTAKSGIAAYTNMIGYNAEGSVHDSNYLNEVGVGGLVSSIKSGLFEDLAVMDGVNVTITDINEGDTSSDPDYKINYLNSHEGQKVYVTIKDAVSGKKVAVEATLRAGSVQNTDGVITAVLDGLGVPVESITNISPNNNG